MLTLENMVLAREGKLENKLLRWNSLTYVVVFITVINQLKVIVKADKQKDNFNFADSNLTVKLLCIIQVIKVILLLLCTSLIQSNFHYISL